MTTIWKYPLQVVDRQFVEMPELGIVRHIAVQLGTPHLWVEVDTNAPLEVREYVTYGTGHTFTQHGIYMGSYFLDGGGLVFHVYEVVKKDKQRAS